MKNILVILLFLTLFACEKKTLDLSYTRYKEGYRYDQEGWIYIHIQGNAYERGYQHGYLIADDYKRAYQCYNDMMYQTMGIKMDFIVEQAIKMHKDKIPKELIDEMQGIADGISAKGIQTTLDEIIGWNAWIDLAESWWPSVKSNYASYIPISVGKRRERCSAFIATGDATKDSKIVITHSSFDDFWNVEWCNVILDIKPSKGHQILMQTTPAYIASMTDFFIMDSGLMGLETSLAGFSGYDEKGVPAYVRVRLAMQYSDNIDEFIQILNDKNNGGNPASWLLGDINTNEIARFEQGLQFQSLEKKKDGYFFGCNVAEDPLIRNLECNGEGYDDIRRHTGGRRKRFTELLEKNYSKINKKISKKIMSDHFDVYKKRIKPGANTICSHYDEDPRLSMSSSEATHPDPYTPAGAVDCKMTTSDLAKEMKILAIFGRACGRSFDSELFLKRHSQWSWQKEYLFDRPSRDWVEFSSKK